jgi:IS1 family transposase
LPVSIIHTDGWAPYIRVCSELNLVHNTVNLKYHFKNPEDETHTNTIEGNNNGLKHLVKPRNHVKKNINGWLYYFFLRSK